MPDILSSCHRLATTTINDMNSLVPSHKVYKIKPHVLDLDARRDATHGFASPPYLNRGSLSCE